MIYAYKTQDIASCKTQSNPRPLSLESSTLSLNHCAPISLSLWDFSRSSRAANSAIPDRTWPKFKIIKGCMVVLATCKNEEDPIKNGCARMVRCIPGTFYREYIKIEYILFLSLYTARPSFDYYRQMYFVHSGLQDESLQVTISKLL